MIGISTPWFRRINGNLMVSIGTMGSRLYRQPDVHSVDQKQLEAGGLWILCDRISLQCDSHSAQIPTDRTLKNVLYRQWSNAGT